MEWVGSSEANILELGAGPGGIWKDQLERVPAGWRVLLTDLMDGMVAEAKTSLGHDARFSFRQMHAEQIDLPDASLDAVIANHMLYHVEDRPRAFREIQRVLKPGGKLIAGTNSERHLVHMQKLIGEFVSGHSNSGMPFSLESGAEQITPFFASVVHEDLVNTLRITEADAVVQYVLSVQAAKEIVVGQKLKELQERVLREINEAGAFVDQTHVGVFIARKL
jgi:ubiquinone/menaquinone biosynthesis C-methylase UbiE